MSCEQAFANFGKKLDDAFYAMSRWRRPKLRSGPSMRERMGDQVHKAQGWVHDQAEKIQAQREDMNPRTRSVLLVMSAMLLGGVAVWAGMKYLGSGKTHLTSEEVQALERMRPTSGSNIFATPALQEQPPDGAQPAGPDHVQSRPIPTNLFTPPR